MPYFIKNNLLLVAFILLVTNLNAQIFPSQHISTLDGLPNNQVESILKDSRGILWIGTNNGLSKIENNVITNFFVEDGLAHNSAWSIIEDANNNIWIGSYGGGVTKFDGKTFTIFNEENGLVNNYIRKLFNYKNYVFVGTKNGLSIINTKNDSISTFDTSSILNGVGVNDFQVMDYFIYKNEIYCATFRTGIFKVDIEHKNLKKVFNYNKRRGFLFSLYLKDNLFYHSIDAQGNEDKGALRKFNIDSLLQNKNEQLTFGKSIIWNYATDNQENLYGAAWGVHTNNGGIFQIKNDTFIDRSADFGVDSKNVRCVYFDTAWNFLYVGTTDNGFYKVDLNENITYYKNKEIDVVAIEYSNSSLAFLNKSGLVLVKNNDIIKEISSSVFYKYAKDYFKVKSFFPIYISDIIVNKKKIKDVSFNSIVLNDNSYWISTNIGLFQLDMGGVFLNYSTIQTNEFEFDDNNYLINPIPYSSLDIIPDVKNYDTSVNHKNAIRYSAEDPNTPVSVSSFIKSNNKIFISTIYRGLFLYENEKFTSLKEKNIFNELEINHLAHIKESNTLVISTTSGEVYLADIAKGFKVLKKINRALINGNSVLFLETYKEAVLIGTNKGLTIYKNGTIKFIDEEQGLVNKNFTSSKVINNELIIGTNSGYYVLNLDKIIHPNKGKLELKIAELLINRETESREKYSWFNYKDNDLELNYDQNSIEINFKVINHPYPNKLLYKYQIKGLDSTWSSYSNKANVFLPYLPSRKFNINVKVKDLNSGEISTSNLLSLVVTPPFWETWWFLLTILLILILIGFVAYKKRIKYITNKEEQKAIIQQRIVETKLEALQSQMNPHFTFNAMNSIQNYIIDNDIDNALMYLGEFAKLIRKTLDNSSQPFIPLSEEISYLKSYIALENMRHNNNVKIKIDFKNVDVDEIDIPPMLIQPFIENVFVHAFKNQHTNPKLIIEFTIENKFLVCRIADNGSGMSETLSGQMHQSKGMILVKERLNLLNKSNANSFKIDSKLGAGTTIILQLEIANYND